MVLFLLSSHSKLAPLERERRIATSEEGRFDRLTKVAELDPRRALRFANWSGIDMSDCDLRQFDFTGSNLRGCRFDGALITGARFDVAQVDRDALRRAADWPAYMTAWKPRSRALTSGHLPDLARFSDAPFAPEMVVIPEGRFVMGSPEDEEGRDGNEGPRHEVRIAYRFALARHPVTFEEFDAFCAATGRKPPSDQTWGRGRRPAINLAWKDATAYCVWLSKATRARYRLPSESEWEYACRAGTRTAYPWGDAWDPKRAHGDRLDPGGTFEVGRFPANDWGLLDVIGNVNEWVADQIHDTSESAPGDGSARTDRRAVKNANRVIRGGFWASEPEHLRSAARDWREPKGSSHDLGFRPARMLNR